jgi:hypothetical protein
MGHRRRGDRRDASGVMLDTILRSDTIILVNGLPTLIVGEPSGQRGGRALRSCT